MQTATKILNYPKKLMGDGDSNTKLRKNGADFETLGLSLSPHKSAGLGNLCTHASSGCIKACLNEQGLASVFDAIKEARNRRTEIFYRDREWFIGRLKTEIGNRCKLAKKRGTRVAVRLNVFSDVIWERVATIPAPDLWVIAQACKHCPKRGRVFKLLMGTSRICVSRIHEAASGGA